VRVLILGAGFGGLELATCLSQAPGDRVAVTLIDKSDSFVFGFAKLDVKFGKADPATVRLPYRYLRDPPPQRKRRSDYGQHRVITPFEPYLLKRWSEGCQTATVLWREIQAQGLAFSVSNVQRFVAE
jgi:hypothetical protein